MKRLSVNKWLKWTVQTSLGLGIYLLEMSVLLRSECLKSTFMLRLLKTPDQRFKCHLIINVLDLSFSRRFPYVSFLFSSGLFPCLSFSVFFVYILNFCLLLDMVNYVPVCRDVWSLVWTIIVFWCRFTLFRPRNQTGDFKPKVMYTHQIFQIVH